MKRFFDHLTTLDAIKTEYKRLVKVHHPDVGGDTATMQAINAQYNEAVKRIARDGEGRDKERAAQEVPEEFAAVIMKAVTLPGLEVELVGCWVWITGDTYTHRAALKAAGYSWAAKKRAWYWRPEWAAVAKGSKKTLDEIRQKYGSERLAASVSREPLKLGAGDRPRAGSTDAAPKKKRAPRRRQPAGQVAFAI